MKNTPYKYSTWQENLVIVATAVAGLGVYTVGLLITFNPWVVAGVGLYAGYHFLANIAMSVPAIRDKMLKPYIQKGEYTKLDLTHPLCQIAKAISQEMGRKKAPDVYLVSLPVVARMSFPLGLKWLAKLSLVKKVLNEMAMPKIFAALPGKNVLLTTREALTQNLTEDHLKFITVHEMGHLKADAFNTGIYGRMLIKKTAEPLALLMLGACALSVVGVALPATLGASVGVG
jgi:Zn-dependent protease with chaperone function